MNVDKSAFYLIYIGLLLTFGVLLFWSRLYNNLLLWVEVGGGENIVSLHLLKLNQNLLANNKTQSLVNNSFVNIY